MSLLNVNKVDPSTGTTLELGTSGDTVNLGSGVTAGTGLGGAISVSGTPANNQLTVWTAADTVEGDSNLTFSTDLTVTGGNVVLGTAAKGIDFSVNTGQSGVTSQILNDYETGTFTPSIASTSGSITTPGTQYGWYIKIGKMVQVQCELAITTAGTAAGNMDITGLPFTSAATGLVHTQMLGKETQTAGIDYSVTMTRDVTALVMGAPVFNNGAGYSINGMYRVA